MFTLYFILEIFLFFYIRKKVTSCFFQYTENEKNIKKQKNTKTKNKSSKHRFLLDFFLNFNFLLFLIFFSHTYAYAFAFYKKMIDFDHELFNKRVTKFYQCWKAQKSTEAWGSGVSAVIVYNSSTISESSFGGRVLDLHFFGYELMDSMLAFLENKLYIIAGVKKRNNNKK